MSTNSVIKCLKAIKGALARLSPCLKRLLINAFPFETVKEGCCHCIIVAIGSAAHAHLYAILQQKREVAFACIGTATIRMRKSIPLVGCDEPTPSEMH